MRGRILRIAASAWKFEIRDDCVQLRHCRSSCRIVPLPRVMGLIVGMISPPATAGT